MNNGKKGKFKRNRNKSLTELNKEKIGGEGMENNNKELISGNDQSLEEKKESSKDDPKALSEDSPEIFILEDNKNDFPSSSGSSGERRARSRKTSQAIELTDKRGEKVNIIFTASEDSQELLQLEDDNKIDGSDYITFDPWQVRVKIGDNVYTSGNQATFIIFALSILLNIFFVFYWLLFTFKNFKEDEDL